MNEYMLKVVVVGNMAVGKTALLLRYIDNTFTENHITTIGVDFKIKTLTRKEGIARMQLWDTAGQDRFRTIVSSYYRGADGLVIVFDVTDKESFRKVETWVQEANVRGQPDCVKFLVGNKTDLVDERVVKETDARALADRLGLKYYETSAKDDSNVHQVFDELADALLERKVKFGFPPLVEGSRDPVIRLESTEVSENGWCAGWNCYQ